MTFKVKVTNTTEEAYFNAMSCVRSAIRGNDLAKAERWMRLAERYWKLDVLADAAAHERAARRRAHWQARRDAGA